MNTAAMVEETSPKTKARLIGGTWGQNLAGTCGKTGRFLIFVSQASLGS